MPVIDHRRHSLRAKPGPDLTPEGVALARRVGAGEFGAVPVYDRVLTSTLPRAFQTAIAMGVAVDEQLDSLAMMGSAAFAEYRWPQPIAVAARALLGSGPAGTFAAAQAELLADVAASLLPEGSALIVSHGGIVEAGAVALLPDADHAAWGQAIGYVEGIRLHFEGAHCQRAELLRLPSDLYVVES
jgi:broad specificity phosphatase PhoE